MAAASPEPAHSDETLLAELIELEAELLGVSAVLGQIEAGIRRALRRRSFDKQVTSAEPE